MSRLPALSFCVLVAATVAAFFITQHLKVTTPLLAGFPRPQPPVINPSDGACGGGVYHRTMHISFYLLHRSDDVDVYVIDQSGQQVATLATGRFMSGGSHPVRRNFTWDGRASDGRVAPDGLYYVKVALRHQGRTVVISDQSGPIPVRVKTRPPSPRVTAAVPHLISAPRDVRIHYVGNERRGGTARIYRMGLPGGPRLVKSFLTPWKGQTAVWDGRIRQLPAPAGVYLTGLDVTDAACNTGHFPPAFPVVAGETPGAGVTVRYLAAQPPIAPVAAGRSATVLVDSRRRAYSWSLRRLGSRSRAARGSSRSYALNLRMPAQPGLYELTLRSGAHATAVPLVAQAARQSKLLVVLPALTWWGRDPGDEDGDGVPDTLLGQSSVELARPLADGMPPGIGDQAGLLRYLDSAHHNYSLTTDFALTAPGARLLSAYRMVVLAGDEEWTTSGLAGALRSYVQGGGHVLSLGIASLQRTVKISGARAVDPTGPAAIDALGARPEPVVKDNTQLIGVLQDHLGIFKTTSGLFRAFAAYQPFAGVAAPARILSAAGASANAPAIIGYRLGRGTVVDLGLPGLGSLLANNLDAQQLLSGVLNVLAR